MAKDSNRTFPRQVIAFLTGFAAFALLWWVITEGRAASWSVGLPLVSLAALWRATLRSDAFMLSPAGLLRFAPFFAWYSFRGGVDVARRALQPEPDLAPAVVEMSSRLPPGPARVLFVYVTGLLPGTQCVDWEGERLHIHTIDRHGGFREELQLLEWRIADLFGLALDPSLSS